MKQKVEEFQRLIEKLPVCNRLLLSWTIIHMTHVITRVGKTVVKLIKLKILYFPTLWIRCFLIVEISASIFFPDMISVAQRDIKSKL